MYNAHVRFSPLGTCFDGVNGYNCSCHNGYMGHNCDVAMVGCLSSPCGHGKLLSYQYKKPGGNVTDKYRTLKDVWNMNNNLDFKRDISHLNRHLK